MTAQNIRRFREGVGLSQRELARRLGVARATVTRWENGSRRPSRLTWLAIRKALEVRATRGWEELAGVALNELWDNPEDAIYDDWQSHYQRASR